MVKTPSAQYAGTHASYIGELPKPVFVVKFRRKVVIGAQIINGGQQCADLHNLKYNKSIIFTTVRDNTGRKKYEMTSTYRVEQ